MANLEEIKEYQSTHIDDWSKRRGKTLTPPYPADSPCYYCGLWEEFGLDACNFCIQNPAAAIQELEA